MHSIKFSGGKDEGKVVQALLEAGASISETCPEGYTALHRPARSGQPSLVEMLIRRRADVNARHSRNGRTPLHLACSSIASTKAKTVDILLRAGADVEAASSRRQPLDYAVETLCMHEIILGGLKLDDDALGADLYLPCNQYRASIEAVDILLSRLEAPNIGHSTQTFVRRSFFFHDMRGFADMPIDEARRNFRERRIFIILQSDLSLHQTLGESNRRHRSRWTRS